MQRVRVGDRELLIAPQRLINYVEKTDFIRSRRVDVWGLVKSIPKTLTVADYTAFVEVAMKTVYQFSSFVSPQEELEFDTCYEGLYWKLWKCVELGRRASGGQARVTMADVSQQSVEPWIAGIENARKLWESATDDEKSQIRMAMAASDQMRQLKNSDGPSENSPQAGPEKAGVQASQ